MSVSGVVSVRQLDVPPAARVDDEKEAAPWTLEDNENNKLRERTQWCKDYKTNANAFAEATATSIFEDFMRPLKVRTGTGLGTDPTSEKKLYQTYPLTLQSNAKAMKEWAGKEAAELPPFKELFDKCIPKEKQEREQIEDYGYSSISSKTSLSPSDHLFVQKMINDLGQKVERLVQQKFAEWKGIDKNKKLETEVKWDPTKTNSSAFSSISKGPSHPSLHVSAWLKDEYAKELEERNNSLIEGLKQPDGGELQPPPSSKSIFNVFKRS